MSIQGVGAGSASSLASTANRFSLSGGAEFSQALNLGQIIKGKVLRQYEGNRYQVSFDGNERVVDSAVPLTAGEIIHGRVIALGDRVELQRVYPEQESGETDSTAQDKLQAELRRFEQREQWMQDLMNRYRPEFSPQDQQALNQIARSVSDPASLGMVGVMLNKLGLQQSPELLLGVYGLLKRTNMWMSGQPQGAAGTDDAATVPPEVLSSALPLTSTRQLADALVKAVGQSDSDNTRQETDVAARGESVLPNIAMAINPRAVRQINDDDAQQDAQQQLWRVINAQVEGAVSHRAGMLPLLLGDRLVEVSVAFFEQQRDADQQPEAKHRQIVFALQTESLGAVQIKAQLSGERVRIRVIAENEARAQEIAGYTTELRALLAQGGWEVDEIAYESRESDGRDAAVASVIEHIAQQNSVNRLV